MKRENIGELEELILLVTGILGQQAYGVTIKQEIAVQTKRIVNISAVHAVLKRLEDKSYLRSEMGGASAIRGGRRKRFYILTSLGTQTLRQVKEVRNNLFDQVPELAFRLA